MRKRNFEVKFEYPAENDVFYDSSSGETFFFGTQHNTETLVEGLNHEIIHFLIHKLKGRRPTLRFDKLGDKVKIWDKKAYELLY
jgi:hypothetical protein